MINLEKELAQCYLTDPMTNVENPLWLIHKEFPYLKDWLLESKNGDRLLVDVYTDFATSEQLVYTFDIGKWIGEGRQDAFEMYFDAAGGCDVSNYSEYINCAIEAHKHYVEQTLLASHKQVVLYAALLYIYNEPALSELCEKAYEELRDELMEAADEFRDEHTLGGVWRQVILKLV